MPILGFIIGAIALLFGITAFTGAPFVPSRRKEIKKAFTNLFPLTKTDFVVDMGAGDGVVLEIAKTFGAKGIWYEINPILVMIARGRGRNVRLKNLWTAQFPPETTLVYAFGDGRDIVRMYRKVQRESSRLGHSLRFMTYGFEIPEVEPTKTYRAYFLYHVKPLSE